MIQLDGITKTFADTTAVDNVTLELRSGKTTVLIGPSGCGKSTLLRLIIGLVEADAGTVTVGSHTVGPNTPPEIRHRMGYVIQDGGLFPHLTGRGNVAILARHLCWSADRVEQRTEELADLVQLPLDRLDQYPNELSGGQRQRISLMRALMLDPDVLLLDEPLGALDPMIRADLQTDLRDIFQTLDKTVVFVTHDLSEAAFVADRVVLLRKGQIVQTGPMSDLLESPATDFARDFVQAQRSILV
ncbi:ABC transporter ATP-binding protein [Longibacter salinarum]|uniref:ABC transporter ATP-binding protein n=1 Tax=Longibacter salinarum TaxID=1850348 RepID=A0A2A8CY58_9BACT|nr:ATP-binding cassette domain-containing protein [Longibacter salinarum]PEN13543.1 ABC transporter ATP-binding protein [Longibacter salinarum]